jgi:hypothetical protein
MERYHQPRIGPDRRARDRRARRAEPAAAARPGGVRLRGSVAVALGAMLAGLTFIHWTRTADSGTPLDRAETVCRSIARSPHDSLAAGIESDVEFRRERAVASGAPGAPVAALVHALGLDESRILRRWAQHVGDYDVAAMWVRLPDDDRHALVVGWIESDGVAWCRFRFTGRGATLSADELERGDDLLDRVLVDRNFRARNPRPRG